MGIYSANVSTTSNANTGTAIQVLAASGKDMQLVGVMLNVNNVSGTQTPGKWQIDRITAVDGTNGTTYVPLKLNPTAATSTITATAHTIATDLSIVPTVGDADVVTLSPGWNWFMGFDRPAIMAGASNGFALKRATAPSGAQVVDATLIWMEI